MFHHGLHVAAHARAVVRKFRRNPRDVGGRRIRRDEPLDELPREKRPGVRVVEKVVDGRVHIEQRGVRARRDGGIMCAALRGGDTEEYTRETLSLVARHVDEVQTALKRPMLIENPSTYVRFTDNDMSEIEFLAELRRQSGCGLLLDVNNVYVQAMNHDFDPAAFIDQFPVEHVGEIHLAGHATTTDETGAALIIDAHDRKVMDEVWALYRRTIAHAGAKPTLIEWDNDIPEWPVLLSEATLADTVMTARRSNV